MNINLKSYGARKAKHNTWFDSGRMQMVVECVVGLGAMCEIKVWFTYCLVYLIAFNTDTSTLGSTRF